MARPYKMTADRGLQPDTSVALYVKRDTMTNLWRLAWMVPGETTYCYAEGECSARLFKTRRAAKAYARQTYGEDPRHWS